MRFLVGDRAVFDLAHFGHYSRLRSSGLSYREAWAEMDRLWASKSDTSPS